MAAQTRRAAIVGIHEYPLRVAPGVSAMQIKAASIRAALDDAGLAWSDVDGLYDTADGEGGGGLGLPAYLGVRPAVIDTTQVGGSSFEFQAAHALRDIAAGKCRVAVLSYGSTAHSERRAIGTGGMTGQGPPNWQGNMEDPYGVTLIAGYAMVKTRHMHEYGSTDEQFAELAVATRAHAMRNPEAVRAMNDLEFGAVHPVGEIGVADVLESRVIADPLPCWSAAWSATAAAPPSSSRPRSPPASASRPSGSSARARPSSTARTAATSPPARARRAAPPPSAKPASAPARSTSR